MDFLRVAYGMPTGFMIEAHRLPIDCPWIVVVCEQPSHGRPRRYPCKPLSDLRVCLGYIPRGLCVGPSRDPTNCHVIRYMHQFRMTIDLLAILKSYARGRPNNCYQHNSHNKIWSTMLSTTAITTITLPAINLAKDT